MAEWNGSSKHSLEVSGQFQVMVDLAGCYGDKKNNVLPPVNEIRIVGRRTCTLVTPPIEISRFLMVNVDGNTVVTRLTGLCRRKTVRNTREYEEPPRGNSMAQVTYKYGHSQLKYNSLTH